MLLCGWNCTSISKTIRTVEAERNCSNAYQNNLWNVNPTQQPIILFLNVASVKEPISFVVASMERGNIKTALCITFTKEFNTFVQGPLSSIYMCYVAYTFTVEGSV